MKRTKVAVSFLLMLALMLSVSVTAFASGTNEPPEPTSEEYDTSTFAYLGQLSEQEVARLNAQRAFGTRISVYNAYTGVRDRGLVANVVKPSAGGRLTYSEARTVSNSFSANVGISGDIVSAGVGFNVGYSTTATASYYIDIPNGGGGEIGLRDIYTVKEYNIYVFIDTIFGRQEEYAGAGWAEQWQRFEFYSRVY